MSNYDVWKTTPPDYYDEEPRCVCGEPLVDLVEADYSDYDGTDIRMEGRCPMCEPTPEELAAECDEAHGMDCLREAECVWCGQDVCRDCYEDHKLGGDPE